MSINNNLNFICKKESHIHLVRDSRLSADQAGFRKNDDTKDF